MQVGALELAGFPSSGSAADEGSKPESQDLKFHIPHGTPGMDNMDHIDPKAVQGLQVSHALNAKTLRNIRKTDLS